MYVDPAHECMAFVGLAAPSLGVAELGVYFLEVGRADEHRTRPLWVRNACNFGQRTYCHLISYDRSQCKLPYICPGNQTIRSARALVSYVYRALLLSQCSTCLTSVCPKGNDIHIHDTNSSPSSLLGNGECIALEQRGQGIGGRPVQPGALAGDGGIECRRRCGRGCEYCR